MNTDSDDSGFVAAQWVAEPTVEVDEPVGDDGFCFDLTLPTLLASQRESSSRMFYFVGDEPCEKNGATAEGDGRS